MNIGIASPINISELKIHLKNLKRTEENLGLGGTAINIIIDGLIKNGHKVTVFTLDPTVKEKHILEGPKLKVIIGHFRSSNKIKTFDFCRKEIKQIKLFINEEKENLDIVNAHWSYEFAIGTILSKVPHLITFRDDSFRILKLTKHPYRLSRLLMDLWVRKKGKHFSYNSPYLKSGINLAGDIIPNPINDYEIEQKRVYPTKKEIQICYVANGWTYFKNPETALLAFNIANTKIKNIKLTMIGEGLGESSKNYKQICKKGLNMNVIFRGKLPHRKFLKELHNFDIMLHTAREESFGNNIIEAMAKGIPVIAGKNSGAVPWVLNYGAAGCLIDIEKPEIVANAIAKLVNDKYYYEKLSIEGLSNVVKRFSQKEICRNYIELYKNIVCK
ncbi:glycosyltransferase family 4 protein [Cyclobacterium roseum]|uniref:glycosyltransferase family 4 protein n=1 Tax=Cyclobacterium roseum TaxID=2666137 RepID=UPI0013916CAA|nr:glycosyltransferase family 4 protein [Cyclobacterium roseum]